MNKRARTIIDKSCKETGLVWTEDALPYKIIRNIVFDIDTELSKTKYIDMSNIDDIRQAIRALYEDL
ncbi:MAG: hypothetical protein EBU90_07320 [Proteobacteria bacterium]|nr:hypothetical protein [Pseudomonadota bacterium]NBP13487.1 hypothetical protein [bacterium]